MLILNQLRDKLWQNNLTGFVPFRLNSFHVPFFLACFFFPGQCWQFPASSVKDIFQKRKKGKKKRKLFLKAGNGGAVKVF